MAEEVTVAQARLTVDNAQAEIDRVITSVLYERRPGYLLLPSDVAAAPLAALPLPLARRQGECSPEALAAFTAAADALLSRATSAAVLADFLADRFGVGDALNRWLATCGLPHSTLLLGKSVLDEQNPAFTGTYAGAASDKQVRDTLEGANVVITVGVKFTDTITAGFTQQLPPEKTLDLRPFQARVGTQVFNQVPMADALAALQQVVAQHLPRWHRGPVTRPALPPSDSGRLDQPAFWQAMQAFLQPGDILVAEQGTACFGAAALTLPAGCRMLVQPLWGSIGYTLPAAFGAQVAEPDRRVVLLIGDGSAQLTAQELGSMIRDGLKPVIFIINNQGYTVERAIHGPRQRYNDIAPWNWTHLPQALGSRDGQVVALQAADTAQLHDAMAQAAAAQHLALIEVILPKMDIPDLLQAVTQALEQRNSGKTPATE